MLSQHNFSLLFLCSHSDARPLHSFPTRRSSDLLTPFRARPVARAFRLSSGHGVAARHRGWVQHHPALAPVEAGAGPEDRKSTRLNSSHMSISYAVFCLKKKKTRTITFPHLFATL